MNSPSKDKTEKLPEGSFGKVTLFLRKDGNLPDVKVDSPVLIKTGEWARMERAIRKAHPAYMAEWRSQRGSRNG